MRKYITGRKPRCYEVCHQETKPDIGLLFPSKQERPLRRWSSGCQTWLLSFQAQRTGQVLLTTPKVLAQVSCQSLSLIKREPTGHSICSIATEYCKIGRDTPCWATEAQQNADNGVPNYKQEPILLKLGLEGRPAGTSREYSQFKETERKRMDLETEDHSKQTQHHNCFRRLQSKTQATSLTLTVLCTLKEFTLLADMHFLDPHHVRRLELATDLD